MYIQVGRNEKIRVDVIEDTFQYIQVLTEGRVPPVKIIFEYAPPFHGVGHDLRVYVSKSHKQPNDKSCEKQYRKPKLIQYEQFTPEFKFPALFLSLYSIKGCSVILRAVFPKEDEKEEQEKSKDPVPASKHSNKEKVKFKNDVDK